MKKLWAILCALAWLGMVTAHAQQPAPPNLIQGYRVPLTTVGNQDLVYTAGASSVTFTVSGLTGSGATLSVSLSADGGTTWVAGSPATITVNGVYLVSVAGYNRARVAVTTAGTGTASVSTFSSPVALRGSGGGGSSGTNIYTPETYGADPTGTVDATAAIQSALTAATATDGTVQLCGRYLQNSANITQPATVAVVGCQSSFPGASWNNRDYSTTLSTIVQNPAYKWVMGSNARLARLTFISSVWAKPTSFAGLVAQATTSLQGTAIELASDAAVDDVLVLGYATGVHSTNVSRFNLTRVNIDANNCYNLNNMFDISTVENTECYPFTTYNTSWANAHWPVTAVAADGGGQIVLTVGSPAVFGTAIGTLNGSVINVLGPQTMGLTNHYSGVTVSGNNVTLVGSQLNPTATAAITSGSTQMTITAASGIGNSGVGYGYTVTCPSGIAGGTTVSINNHRAGLITLSAAATATVASQTCTFTAPAYTANTATVYFNEVRRAGDGMTLANVQGLRIIAPFVLGHDTAYRPTTGSQGNQFIAPQTDYNTVVNDPQSQSYEEDGSSVWSYVTGGSFGSENAAVVINRTGLFPTTFAGTAMNGQAAGGYLLWQTNGRVSMAAVSDTGTNGQIFAGSSLNGLRLAGVDLQGVPAIQYQTPATAASVYNAGSDIYSSLVFDGGTGSGPRIHGVGASGMNAYLALPGSGGRWFLGTDSHGSSLQTIDPGATIINIPSVTGGTSGSSAALFGSNNGPAQFAGTGSFLTYLGSTTSISQIQGGSGLSASGAPTSTPSSGGSIALTANQTLNLIQGASTLASFTVNFPASPTDRQDECVVTQPAITALTIASLGAAAFDTTPSSVAAHTMFCYRYWASIGANGTWVYENEGSTNGITALTGDVSATGPGSSAATVNSIGGQPISLAGALTTVGAYTASITFTGPTAVKMPTSGTLSTLVTGTTSGTARDGALGTAAEAAAQATANAAQATANLAAMLLFGTGSDGTTASVGCGAISSGTITLTRDINCTSQTLSGTAAIATNGFRIYNNGTLDLSAAQTGAITCTYNAGATFATVPHGMAGRGASNGTTAAGAAGSSGYPTTATGAFGGQTGPSGAGGTGTNAGGASATESAAIGTVALFPNPLSFSLAQYGINGSALGIYGGYGGASGGAGGGDGTNSGGNSGPGGAGGCGIYIAAATIQRGTNTNTAIIQAKGGSGTNGSNSTAGNTGGGGGGAAGGGGGVYIVAGTFLGSAIANAIDVSGGTGGTGGNGQGTGKGGTGGYAGYGGLVQVLNLGANTFTASAFNTVPATNPVAATTAAGTAGGTPTTVQVGM